MPVARLSPEIRRQWLAAHPDTVSAPGGRGDRRRRDATTVAARTSGTLRRHVDDRLAERMSALAYFALPPAARVAAGIRYLVTVRVPSDLDDLAYPHELQYRQRGKPMRSAPVVQVVDWLEELMHLAAHEARHVAQFCLGLAKSEVDAERWAAAAVVRYRSNRAAAVPPAS